MARRAGAAIPGRSVARNATVVAMAFAIGRALGMVREMIIAARFGTGEAYDAYVAAFRLPDMLFAVVISGAFGSAFIPVFGGFLSRDEPEAAWRLANTLLTWTVASLALVTLGIFILAEPLIDTVVAPDLSPDARDLAVRLTRMLLLSPLLLGLGAAAKGMLEAHDAFLLPAIAPVLYNLGIIGGAVALVPAMGIYGLAVGVLLGACAHLGVQFAALLRRGLRLTPRWATDTPGVGTVVRLLGPRIAGQGASQANLIVLTNLASRLGEGSISALNYANQLVLLPHGVLAMSLSTVLFPRMARQFASGDHGDVRRTLVSGLGPLIFLVGPTTVALVAFRTSIVQVAFQYGSFGHESTTAVAKAVALLGLGLPGRALIEPITRAFYAMQNTRTPVAVSSATVLVNIGLGWWLSGRYGLSGLALSMSATYTVRMLVLLALLSRHIQSIARDVTAIFLRMLLPTGAMAAVAVVAMEPLAQATDPGSGRSMWDYAAFLLGLGGAGFIFLTAAWVLRIPELDAFARIIVRMRRSAGG